MYRSKIRKGYRIMRDGGRERKEKKEKWRNEETKLLTRNKIRFGERTFLNCQ